MPLGPYELVDFIILIVSTTETYRNLRLTETWGSISHGTLELDFRT